MRNQLETLKTLFARVRNLGTVQQLPNGKHTQLSENITVWFDSNYEVTSVSFGERYHEKVEITRYSHRDENYKVTLSINITDEELDELIVTIEAEYKALQISYLKAELAKLEETDLIELERGEVVE
jgi:hypothetical protein